ncbi:MAG: hypothetical protein QGG48_09295, partial [Desulfatiglandales bacterium]|nr:hypothetical protein [Desulfatiglandales bacterium]
MFKLGIMHFLEITQKKLEHHAFPFMGGEDNLFTALTAFTAFTAQGLRRLRRNIGIGSVCIADCVDCI